jgi:hypothetical protein
MTTDLRIAAVAAKSPEVRGSLTLGEEPVNWFCEPGDLVGDRVAVREIFKVPDTADVRNRKDLRGSVRFEAAHCSR